MDDRVNFAEVLDAADGLRRGARPPQHVHEAVLENRARLLEERRCIVGAMLPRGRRDLLWLCDQAVQVERVYVTMDAALARFADFADDPQPSLFDTAVYAFSQAAATYPVAFDAWLDAPESEAPLLDYLWRLRTALEKPAPESDEDDEADLYFDTIQCMQTMALDAAAVVPPDSDAGPEAETMLRALQEYVEAVGRLKAAADDWGRVDTIFQQVAAADLLVRETTRSYLRHVLTDHPSPFAYGNLLLNTMQARSYTMIPREIVDIAAQTFARDIADEANDVERLARHATDPAALAQPLETARAAYVRLQEVAAQIPDASDDALEGLRDALDAAIQQLMAVRDEFIRRGERTVPCVRCGTSNPASGAVCRQCGARLLSPPELASSTLSFQEGGAPRFQLTDRLQELLRAADDVLAERADVDALDAAIEPIYSSTSRNLPLAPAHLRQAAAELLAGLDRLRRYRETGDRNTIVAGLQMVQDAVTALQQ